ncbi:DMT family transporter [Maridesulfovibrio sp.]|uniref:DMT family transporter n=1 Tax=Maridesulfovibrio sp. TaxID=2795000 RepID=UPI0029F4B239|nr:DMT family transporter [Maridesulfovibrio sp.]
MTQDNSHKIIPVLSILCAVLLWGSSFAAMKHLVGTLNPWAVMWMRVGFATIILTPFMPKLAKPVRTGKDRVALAIMALFMPCLYFLFESYALTFTTATQAGLISASLPLMVSAGAGFFFKEKTTPTGWAGLALSMAGVAALTMGGTPSGNAANPALGNMLELFAMICAAGYMLLVKRLSAHYGPWTLTAVQNGAGCIFFIPGLYLIIRDGLGIAPHETLMMAGYLGVFVTLGAFVLYNLGISRLPAGKASAFINLVPAIAAFFGWFLLGETLNYTQLLASGVIFAGVGLAQYGEKLNFKKRHLLKLAPDQNS